MTHQKPTLIESVAVWLIFFQKKEKDHLSFVFLASLLRLIQINNHFSESTKMTRSSLPFVVETATEEEPHKESNGETAGLSPGQWMEPVEEDCSKSPRTASATSSVGLCSDSGKNKSSKNKHEMQVETVDGNCNQTLPATSPTKLNSLSPTLNTISVDKEKQKAGNTLAPKKSKQLATYRAHLQRECAS